MLFTLFFCALVACNFDAAATATFFVFANVQVVFGARSKKAIKKKNRRSETNRKS